AINDGLLTLSSDGQSLALVGYAAAVGTSGPENTSSTTPRVIGRVDATGNVNTSTLITDGYSGGEVPAAISLDGNAFYTSGFQSSGGGVRLVALGSPGSSLGISSTFNN